MGKTARIKFEKQLFYTIIGVLYILIVFIHNIIYFFSIYFTWNISGCQGL